MDKMFLNIGSDLKEYLTVSLLEAIYHIITYVCMTPYYKEFKKLRIDHIFFYAIVFWKPLDSTFNPIQDSTNFHSTNQMHTTFPFFLDAQQVQ